MQDYRTISTSLQSAKVEDIVLSEEEDGLTRRIARPMLVENTKDTGACVKICLMHQKRHSRNEKWKDADCFNLRQMKAGEEVRFPLDSIQTLRLHSALQHLHALGNDGVPLGERCFTVLDASDGMVVTGKAREVVQCLLDQHGEELWNMIEELQPDILSTIGLKKLHESRVKAVELFREAIDLNNWPEKNWEDFFQENKWIFGHGLDYQFLGHIQRQPHYGGTTLNGTGGQRGDSFMATSGKAKFTVIVDIKKSNSVLVKDELYRNKTYELGEDLVGGVTQLQSYCRTWVIEGSRQDENKDFLESEHIFTYEPKGILVIGDTSSLDNPSKRATFHMFRRNLHNPEILTYDELLVRAEYMISLTDIAE